MARPREYGDRINIGLRLPVELHERLAEAAAERDISVTRMCTRAIERYLDALRPLDELLTTTPWKETSHG